MIALGIDVGTTHTKVLALDVTSGATLALESASTPVRRDGAGEAHRPADVLATVVELIGRVAGALDDSGAIRAVCVASVGEEVVLLDGSNRAVGDAIAWYDPRGFDEAAAYLSGDGGESGALATLAAGPHLLHLQAAVDPRLTARATTRPRSTWTDLGDYVLAGLGGAVVMDWSHASRAGAFDLAERTWDSESIGAAGLELAFPRLVSSMTVIGRGQHGHRPHVGAARLESPSSPAATTTSARPMAPAYAAAPNCSCRPARRRRTLRCSTAPLEGEAAARVDQGCFVDADSYYVHINIHSGHFFQGWRRLLYGDTDDEAMYAEVAGGARGRRRHHLRADRRPAPRASRRRALRRRPRGADARHPRRAGPTLGCHHRRAGGRQRQPLRADPRRRTPHARGRSGGGCGWRPTAGPWPRSTKPESTAFGAAVMAAQAVGAPGADALVARRVAWKDERRPHEQRSG